MTVSRQNILLISFRTKIEEAVSIVPRMPSEEKFKAVQFWNIVSEKLQDIVNKCAADINAVAYKMDNDDDAKVEIQNSTLNPISQTNPLPQDFIASSSSNYTSRNEPSPPLIDCNSSKSDYLTRTALYSQTSDIPSEPTLNMQQMHGYKILSDESKTMGHRSNNCDMSELVNSQMYSERSHTKFDSMPLSDKADYESENQIRHLQKSTNLEDKEIFESEHIRRNLQESPDLQKGTNPARKKMLEEIIKSEDMDSNDCDINESELKSVTGLKEAICDKTISPKGIKEPRVKVNLRKKKVSKVQYQKRNSTDSKSHNKCKICRKQFEDPESLAAHSLLHNESLSCTECSAKFVKRNSLIIHMRKHTGEKPYPCPDCSSSFATRGNLTRHQKTHSGERPWKCKECDNCFTEKKSLIIHMRRHTGERPYSCNVCGKTFTQVGVMRTHMAMHLDLKVHLCELCGKSFRQKSQLRIHKLRHDNVRQYCCNVCTAYFLTRSDLDRHTRTHTGEKPYVCDVCSKSFTRQQSLNEHLNRHYNIKPYVCKVCSKQFSEMSACYKHIKSHEQTRKDNPKAHKKINSTEMNESSKPPLEPVPENELLEEDDDNNAYFAVVLDATKDAFEHQAVLYSATGSNVDESANFGVLTAMNLLRSNVSSAETAQFQID